VSKYCGNCKFNYIPAHKTPCLPCTQFENWEPVEPVETDPLNRFCGTCKHSLLSGTKEPCATCITGTKKEERSLWEPLDPEPVKEAIKSCGTCEHKRVFSTDTSYFCHRCAGLNEWEQEEDAKAKEVNDERICCPFPNGGQLYCRQEKCGTWAVDGRTGTGKCALVMIAEQGCQ